MFKKKCDNEKCEHDWEWMDIIMESEIVSAVRNKLKQPEIGWWGGYTYKKKICILCGEKINEIPEAYDKILEEEIKRIKARQSFTEDSWEEIKNQPINIAI